MRQGMTELFGRKNTRQLTMIAATVFAALFVILAITGAVRMFSPVPFWDMWGGTLGFYIATQDGNSSIWWAQHNEHRIVLSRMLFWLDYKLFGGMSVFLIVMNFIIVAMAIILFWRVALARLAAEPARYRVAFIVCCFLTAWLYQWMQHENLGWAFQSQFFLAQFLPLLSFYLLHKSVSPASPDRPASTQLSFACACIVGVASAGTMANGVLALPLLTLYAIIVRLRWWQVLTLAVLTAVTLSLYFNNYTSPGYHGSISEAILEQPLQLVHFVALYLGTPFFYLFGQSASGSIAAVTSTAAMASITFTYLYLGLRNPRDNALQLALVSAIVYLVGTAAGTGGGRLIFGVYQAISYRYTTPALMAWACVLMLTLPWLLQTLRSYPRSSSGLILGLLSLMLIQQLGAARAQHNLVFNRNVAGLVLELEVRDETQIGSIYEMSDGLLRTAEVASRYNLTIFGAYPWRDLKETIGQPASVRRRPTCAGNIDLASPIDTDPAYLRVDGWLLNHAEQVVPELITITSAGGQIAGYALAGQPRPDVTDAIGSHAALAGFRGYIKADLANETVILLADKAPCELITDLP